jgi:hypothetical protein
VVLAGGHRDDRVAIRNCEHARFVAVEALFDHDLVAGIAELAVDADSLDGGERLIAIFANDDALTGGETIGFHDDRRVVAILEIGCGAARVAEDSVLGGGDIGVAKQVFAEDFACFQFRGGLRGSEGAEARFLESVDKTSAERRFRADDREADLVALCEIEQAFDIGRRDIDVLGIGRGAGVTRRNEHTFGTTAETKFPSQGVFAATISNNEDLHRAVCVC